MKPRKKQRIESEGKPGKADHKTKLKDVSSGNPEDSLEDEALMLIEDEDAVRDGKISYPQTITKADDSVIEDEPDSEDDFQDDFQDVKSKSNLLSNPLLISERKKQSKDPASFANAMSAILSSSLKAHTRAVSTIPCLQLTPGPHPRPFKIPN